VDDFTAKNPVIFDIDYSASPLILQDYFSLNNTNAWPSSGEFNVHP